MRDFSKHSDKELYAMLPHHQPTSEPAFAELYARYSQRVYAYCLRLLGDNEDAKDTFQEVFIRFFNEAKECTLIDNVASWLFVIAHNVCVNFNRDRKHFVSIDDVAITVNNQLLEQKEFQELLASSLECLTTEMREAFVLRFYQGMSYEDISKITETPAGVIRNRVWRAKEKLKSIFSEYMQDILK